jgi:hypothetical protein
MIPRPGVAGEPQTWSGASLTLGYDYNKDHHVSGLTASDTRFLPANPSAKRRRHGERT